MTAIQIYQDLAVPFSLSISQTTAEALTMPPKKYDMYIDTPRYKKALKDEFIQRYTDKDEILLKWLKGYKLGENQ